MIVTARIRPPGMRADRQAQCPHRRSPVVSTMIATMRRTIGGVTRKLALMRQQR
jgi:hypothetical protein